MSSRITFSAERQVAVIAEPEPELTVGQVRVKTLYSGISTGTELASYRGTSPHLTRGWDDRLRLFSASSGQPPFPVLQVGYEEVGEVVEIAGTPETIGIGDRVWGTWGHSSSAVLDATHAAARVLPPGADPRVGIFSHIGAVALNAILDADIHVGEFVVVFGLGVPGQLVAQLARLNGGRVLVVDGIESRRTLALKLGAELALDPREPVAERIRELTGGRGADVAIEISGNARALHEAIRSVGYNSRVVVAGFLQGDAIGLRLGEEFHHNRVQLISSQISNPAAALSHRWDRYRLNTTVLDLAIAGQLDVLSLITQTVALTEIADAYRALDENPQEQLQVIIDFR